MWDGWRNSVRSLSVIQESERNQPFNLQLGSSRKLSYAFKDALQAPRAWRLASRSHTVSDNDRQEQAAWAPVVIRVLELKRKLCMAMRVRFADTDASCL
jgi:hypothetical protein